jgi:beta-glucanase (GH16 family)
MHRILTRLLGLTLPLGLVALCGVAPPPKPGPPLDLKGYKISFDDEFTSLSISAHGPGTRWSAHTPWSGDFGDAQFVDPGQDGVFSLNKNGLAITASKDKDGKWHSGLISSAYKDNDPKAGFTQEYGYFEMKAKLPSGMGTWPAFWLIGSDKRKSASEIDVIEYYGGFPSYFHSTEHVWVGSKNQLLRAKLMQVAKGSLSSQFNLFGVLITPKTTSFYLNRKEYWSTPTPPQYDQPMYMLANLALGGGWPIKDLSSPQVMQIRYIRAYQKD